MRCPFCHIDNDKVLDTRALDDGYVIRRRRRCVACNRRFSTQEQIERTSIRVVKRDNSREPFDMDKLRSGIERACWKRPVSTERIQTMVMAIELEIRERFEVEVESQQIGEIVMQKLSLVDQVASIRFASVYRDFSNAQDFIQEISAYLPTQRRIP
jgi:transcriptional repressor NrdR